MPRLQGPGENAVPDTALGRAFLRVTTALTQYGGQTASQGGTSRRDADLAFNLFAASRGVDALDTRNFVRALIVNVSKLLKDGGKDAYEDALTSVLYSAFFAGVETGRELAGIADLEPAERWWEPRRKGEMTPYYLGRVLDELGLDHLAKRARLGHFDDYQAPDDVADGIELVHLIEELTAALWATGLKEGPRVLTVIEAVKDGEFDATKSESDRWAVSKAGQETFKRLAEGK